MSSKLGKLSRFVGGSLLLILFAGVLPVSAQVVDPCRYGCPKDGCNCPGGGGGPIGNAPPAGSESKSEKAVAADKTAGDRSTTQATGSSAASSKPQAKKDDKSK